MTLLSPFKTSEVLEILRNEVDSLPSCLGNLVSLNTNYYVGTSDVCGVCTEVGFELRNRSGSGFSLRAKGRFLKVEDGTEIAIEFRRPILLGIFGLLLNRYGYDKEKIVNFLQAHLKARPTADQGTQVA